MRFEVAGDTASDSLHDLGCPGIVCEMSADVVPRPGPEALGHGTDLGIDPVTVDHRSKIELR
jgi:hypothetical protein